MQADREVIYKGSIKRWVIKYCSCCLAGKHIIWTRSNWNPHLTVEIPCVSWVPSWLNRHLEENRFPLVFSVQTSHQSLHHGPHRDWRTVLASRPFHSRWHCISWCFQYDWWELGLLLFVGGGGVCQSCSQAARSWGEGNITTRIPRCFVGICIYVNCTVCTYQIRYCTLCNVYI